MTETGKVKLHVKFVLFVFMILIPMVAAWPVRVHVPYDALHIQPLNSYITVRKVESSHQLFCRLRLAHV